jgi:hypothetical protein
VVLGAKARVELRHTRRATAEYCNVNIIFVYR